MRKFLAVLACTGGALLLCDPAAAQSASRDINLSASVGKFCRIANLAAPAALNQAFTIDNTTITVDTTPIPVAIGRIRCNTAASFQLSSAKGALTSAGAPSPADAGFANYINYTASISVPVSATVDADVVTGVTTPTSGIAVDSTGARTNDNVSVTITPTTTDPLMYDGGTDYTDTLTITITPL